MKGRGRKTTRDAVGRYARGGPIHTVPVGAEENANPAKRKRVKGAAAVLKRKDRQRGASTALETKSQVKPAGLDRQQETHVAGGVEEYAKGGRLTAAQRHALPSSDFALPGERYPINNPSHARNALARVSQHGSPEEKQKVRSAVRRKYPGIKQAG